ncbi:hypothetical protein [Ferrimicrobium sp.]|uniref:hypothetical protein n=1 Tax=Ferrimicrobium sp. TaxID=2926050 RepID=UPI00261B311D|nr:hypothetical protein [Ferrimicrobium sp.]
MRLKVIIKSGSVLLGAASLSSLSMGMALSASTPYLSPARLVAAAIGVNYPINAIGETYGSAAGFTVAQEPDLIAAIGTANDGSLVSGYVRSSQLDAATGYNVNSPLAAIAWMSQTRTDTIPLYAQDGATVLGTFAIVPGQNPNTSTAELDTNTSSGSCGDVSYYGPVKGWNYNNQSCIVFSTGSAGSYGDISVNTDEHDNAPSGYMGILARVFADDGDLCEESSWYYNDGSAAGIEDAVYRPAAVCGAGYYYSSGLSRAYNGDGYYTYSSSDSPNKLL